MTRRTTQRGGDAFTLTELVVVIAVIGIAAGVFLPVLARSKGSGQTARCASNLRQLAIAVNGYWDDHDGRTFRYRGAMTNNGDVFWFGWLERGSEGLREFDSTAGPLYPYLKNWNATLCPSFSHRFEKFKPKATSSTCGYGVNLHLTATNLMNIDLVQRPGDTVAFADSAQVNTFQAPASPSNPMIEEFYYVSTNDFEATAHFRHRRTANAVFCDGHVEREKPKEGSIDKRMPEHVVGRLPPERLRIH